METFFLTDEEVGRLTGLKRKSAQVAWLRKSGIPFRVNAAGRPIICRSQLDGSNTRPAVASSEWTPAVLR